MGGLVLDLSDPGYLNDLLDPVETVINLVAREVVPDPRKRLSRLSKDAASIILWKIKSTEIYVDCFAQNFREFLF